jgi:adenylate cyclase
VASACVLSVIAALSVILLPRLSYRIPVPAAAAVLYLGLVVWQFKAGVLMAAVTPLAALALSLMGSFVYLSATEGREKRKVRRMLGQYVSPHVLSELVDRAGDVIRAEVGAREHVTLLFSDIRGFTTISENMEPDRIVSMLNRYFSLWSDVIFKYDGTIDKFVGDAVMALWGAPLRVEDHARKAVLAACEMVHRLPELNRELEAEGYQPLHIGIGINTGEAILGNIGSERKLDYTVIGDTVNLASRVEGLTKQYACDILITEFTYEELGGEVPCLPIDEVKVKGKDIPVKIFKVEHRQAGI